MTQTLAPIDDDLRRQTDGDVGDLVAGREVDADHRTDLTRMADGDPGVIAVDVEVEDLRDIVKGDLEGHLVGGGVDRPEFVGSRAPDEWTVADEGHAATGLDRRVDLERIPADPAHRGAVR